MNKELFDYSMKVTKPYVKWILAGFGMVLMIGYAMTNTMRIFDWGVFITILYINLELSDAFGRRD